MITPQETLECRKLKVVEEYIDKQLSVDKSLSLVYNEYIINRRRD